MDFEEAFAKAILKAQEIFLKKESWDCQKLFKENLREAADEAAESVGFDLRMNEPVFLLIYKSWNDIRAWAVDILEIKDEPAK